MKAKTEDIIESGEQDEQILDDNQLVCLLTGEVKKDSSKEKNLQSVVRMLNEEYKFELEDMEREFSVSYVDPETGKTKKQRIDLVVFEKDTAHFQENVIRLCIIQDEKVKDNDKKKGAEATLKYIMGALENCEFGLWSNGLTYLFFQKEIDEFGNEDFIDISDFPGEGETMDDLERPDRSAGKIPVNDSLVKTFKRCHDYIYGNEGMKKTAFWELLNLIFCKLYDEKERFNVERSGTYRRKFWVGVKEKNTPEGLSSISKRIKTLFEELKKDNVFKEVFDGNERINLTEKGLAFVAGELAKYSFLDASVDVKGTAYETIVSDTLKKEDGQFFTPRNIIRCMVEMLDPQENQRVLDPACGSGGFLVMVLDHVRKKIASRLFPGLESPYIEEKYNSTEVNLLVKEYAEQYLFGFDFDPDLKKSARMNMVMSGDGHANVFHINSLAYPKGDNRYELDQVNNSIKNSISNSDDRKFPFEYDDARGKFDLIFTNPPFGAKIPINDRDILDMYDLGRNSSSEPPEILFIEACYNYLKPGGKMAIVLPDGILGNPNTLDIREWILDKFRILASIDLAVEAFLPQVGVQASLLFMQKKTETERQLAKVKEESYDVLMAMAEKLGKDRRGNPIYIRDEDGAEILFEEEKKYIVNEKNGTRTLKVRREKVRKVDDELPSIVEAYYKFIKDSI
jgi:type I restriction enzyme M protein